MRLGEMIISQLEPHTVIAGVLAGAAGGADD